MDGRARWRDNVFVERLWRSVNYEEVYLLAYVGVSQAQAGVGCLISPRGGTCYTFDQTKGVQPMQLPRQAGVAVVRQVRLEIGAAHAVDVEFRTLQGPQQPLFGTREEVQALDRALAFAVQSPPPAPARCQPA